VHNKNENLFLCKKERGTGMPPEGYLPATVPHGALFAEMEQSIGYNIMYIISLSGEARIGRSICKKIS
jgi:hypothetical protein